MDLLNNTIVENLFVFTYATSTLLLLLCTVLILVLFESSCRTDKHNCSSSSSSSFSSSENLIEPSGPRPWPVIGSLHLLGGYKVPYQAFNVLSKRYGQVFKMNLGSVPCVVINGVNNIKEVLINKYAHFDGRPNFRRYHQLFNGDKDNSLAFCNWSEVQKMRREMLRTHTFPRSFTERFHKLDTFINTELNSIKSIILQNSTNSVAIKPLVLHACANIFTSYFCSKQFDIENKQFQKMIRNFDEIFYEVNQGYAADFISWLLPFHGHHLAKLAQWSHEIREFMLSSIVSNRPDSWTEGQEQDDYIDSLLAHVRGKKEPQMTWETALFALEDIVGGHSAVGNFLVKALVFIATHPEVQRKIQQEVDEATMSNRDVSLTDRLVMPYTEAVVFEVIRLIASPIVPHVATQDSSVAGFRIKKDTLIFLNNYDLSMSTDLWTNPEAFQPERFINADGRVIKPDHFLPFGGGRRSCMGYKIVQLVSFSTIASLLQTFNILPVDGTSYKVPIGNLALPFDTFNFKFEKR